MAQPNRRIKAGFENVLTFVRPSEPNCGSAALARVYQAAELFNEIEERARETEARAQALCASAAQRLRSAEARVELAEQSRREIITDADAKLQAASRALKQAELQITAAEDKATAAEVRAQLAEAKARDALEALALVEGAIRKQLLCTPASHDASKLSCTG